MPGITAAAPRDETPHGLTVTLEGGGRAWWTITGASPAGTAQNSRPAREDPVPVPDLTSRPVPVAAVEQALIAAAVAHAGGQVCSIDRYSIRLDPPAVRYGATIAYRDDWKLFLDAREPHTWLSVRQRPRILTAALRRGG